MRDPRKDVFLKQKNNEDHSYEQVFYSINLNVSHNFDEDLKNICNTDFLKCNKCF